MPIFVPPPIDPPSSPKKRRGLLIAALIGGGVLILLLAVYLAFRAVLSSGITENPDNIFGDQYLKTSIALVELHKTRFGKYPDTLGDLKFIGGWDQAAIENVEYYPNAERTGYYIEVRRGWVGKPNLQMPDEFWQGTGYSASLKPKGKRPRITPASKTEQNRTP